MEFIDNTGHVFSLPHYDSDPIGYEYEPNPYIFWVDDENQNKLSIGNYYIKVIRFVLECPNKNDVNYIANLELTLDSKKYAFIKPNKIQELLEKNQDISKYIEIDAPTDNDPTKNDITNYICKDDYKVGNDYLILNNLTSNGKNKYFMIPIYIVTSSDTPGSWLTNILIHLSLSYGFNDEVDEEIYCPITVGAVFDEMNESLIINGENMGIKLPLDIMKAIYQQPLYNTSFNETLYTEKIKEYLLNYMNIKGECGNYNSVINSIKWFGWGDKIEISKLFKTNNDCCNQFILDYFDVWDDVIHSYKTFKSSIFISLMVNENQDTEEINKINFNNDFWGEGKPIKENLFTKIIEDNSDKDYVFYRPYYEYMLNEMAIKLTCMKYYLEKYFLPIHIKIHNASVNHKVYANDIKFLNRTGNSITEKLIDINKFTSLVEFPNSNKIYYHTQTHYFDENYNEFTNTGYKGQNTKETIFFINDNCLSIPLKFKYRNYEELHLDPSLEEKDIFVNIYDNKYYDKNGELWTTGVNRIWNGSLKESKYYGYSYTETGYYDCILLLEKKENGKYKQIFESSFKFYQDNVTKYKNFIICPNKINEQIKFWLGSEFRILICVNTNWFEYEFTCDYIKPIIEFGKLEYEYYYDKSKLKSYFNQINSTFNKTEINLLFDWEEIFDITNKDGDYVISNTITGVQFNSFMWEPNLVRMNNSNLFKQISKYGNKNTLSINKDKTIDGYTYQSKYLKYIVINNQIVVLNEGLLTPGNIIEIPYEYLTNGGNIYVDYEYIYTIGIEELEGAIELEDVQYNFLLESEELEDPGKITLIYQEDTDSFDLYNKYCRIINLPVCVSKIKTMDYIIEKYYKQHPNVIRNPKYLNRVHMFNILKNGEVFNYYPTDSIYEIYSIFFDDNGKCKINLYNNDYDFYLMHDDKVWYGIFISKWTLSKLISNKVPTYFEYRNFKYSIINNFNITDYDLGFDWEDMVHISSDNEEYNADNLIPTYDNIELNIEWEKIANIEYNEKINEYILYNNSEIIEYVKDEDGNYIEGKYLYFGQDVDKILSDKKTFRKDYDNDIYTFKFVKSDNKFLINRMKYVDTNGNYKFDNDDILVVTITNNDNLHFNVENGTKWTFKPVCKTYMDKTVKSNTEMAIISLNEGNIKYDKGFYRIKCEYTLDNHIEDVYEVESKILIK